MRIESRPPALLPAVVNPKPRERETQAPKLKAYAPPPPPGVRGHLIDRYA